MNWWKQASWYNKEPRVAPPEEVGYDPSWGEHHGPVSYIPDTWNYGGNGYDRSRRPMPLPKKLYHVTPNSPAIINEGFRNFPDSNDQTFGGHGQYVSLTTLNNARVYRNGLQDLWDLAYGNLTAEDIPSLGRKWGLTKKGTERLWAEVERESQIHGYPHDEQRKIADFMQKMTHVYSEEDHFKGHPRFPMFFGTMRNLLSKLKDKDQQNLGIIEAQPPPLQWHNGVNVGFGRDEEQMQDKYTYNGSENEWRIWNPKHLDPTKLRRLAPEEYLR